MSLIYSYSKSLILRAVSIYLPYGKDDENKKRIAACMSLQQSIHLSHMFSRNMTQNMLYLIGRDSMLIQ
jgi:hypothetical protein